LEKVVKEWDDDKIIDALKKYKLVYIESKDVA